MLSPSKIDADLGVVYIVLRELVKISNSFAHFGETELDLVLKPKNLDWNSNPKLELQMLPKLRLRLESMVFQLRSHIWSQDLLKFRFLMFHSRNNSLRDKVIGKKWTCLKRNTLHRQSVGHLRRPQVRGCQFLQEWVIS